MNTKEKQTIVLNLQLFGTILFVVSLVNSYILTYDEKLDVLGKKKIFSDKQAQTLSVFNRSLVFGLSILFLLTSYANTEIAKEKGENIESYQLQNVAAELSALASLIVLYVILSNFGTSDFNVSKIENPGI